MKNIKDYKIKTSFVSPEGPITNILRLDFSDALFILYAIVFLIVPEIII